MKTALVVEDNPLVRELILSCLAGMDVGTRSAKSAEEAIDSIRQEGKPDLILCDVLLPQRSGTDFIRHLRAHAPTRRIPVVAVTVLADEQAAHRLRAAGFNDVIAKPIDPEHFAAQVARWLK